MNHGEERLVLIPVDNLSLEGNLAVPSGARGVVLFAHGSGSSRHSPRNNFVAQVLRNAGLATLLMDLLSVEEERIDQATGDLRFDIDLLSRRLTGSVDWLREQPETAKLEIGCFGASTGAAAALQTAVRRPQSVRAVVSRGGRADMAGEALKQVRVPTLLIVGGRDEKVLELNRLALDTMSCKKRLEIVPGATHLFEQRGALERVADFAADWFLRHLGKSA
jgi:putative phosphoribosyl transferase